MKVLGVSPQFPSSTFWSFSKAVKYLGRKAAMPPTGLATVLGMLPESHFEALPIIDMNVEPLRDEHIDAADIVFTSTMIVQENSHNEVIERVHRRGKKVVAGGPFPTSYPDRCRRADHLVAGEAEVALGPFLDDLIKGTALSLYTPQNVGRRATVPLTRTGRVDITHTPLPRWDLLNPRHYVSGAIQQSRGCPFDCEFCDITSLYGREPRIKSPDQMSRELDALYAAGFRGSLFIVDDNFIGNRARVAENLRHIAAWQRDHAFPFSLYTEASLNLAWDSYRDIRELMVEAGFDEVFVGIESPDPDVLDRMGKAHNKVMSPLQAVHTLQKTGLSVTAGFIVGSDGEKPKVFDELARFIQASGIVIAMPGLLTALRGTKLHKRLEREGRLRHESDGNNTHRLGFNFEPEQDDRTLISGYKWLLDTLYGNARNYFERCCILQDNLGARGSTPHVNRDGLRAAARSLNRQLLAPGGWEYAKYLSRTLLRHPTHLPDAIALGIKYDHFRSITEATLKADAYVPKTERLYDRFARQARKTCRKYEYDFELAMKKLSKMANRYANTSKRWYDRLPSEFRDGYGHVRESFHRRVDQLVEYYQTHRALPG